jgi:glucuronate isomerase
VVAQAVQAMAKIEESVGENAATAKTLEHQAKAMDQRVSFFKLEGATSSRAAAA